MTWSVASARTFDSEVRLNGRCLGRTSAHLRHMRVFQSGARGTKNSDARNQSGSPRRSGCATTAVPQAQARPPRGAANAQECGTGWWGLVSDHSDHGDHVSCVTLPTCISQNIVDKLQNI